jgi:hypothetical protein
MVRRTDLKSVAAMQARALPYVTFLRRATSGKSNDDGITRNEQNIPELQDLAQIS